MRSFLVPYEIDKPNYANEDARVCSITSTSNKMYHKMLRANYIFNGGTVLLGVVVTIVDEKE